MQAKISSGQTKDLTSSARNVKGVQVLSTRVEAKDPKSLREIADRLKDRIRSGIILLGAKGDGKVMLLCAVTPDLTDKYPAQKLIKEVAQYVGGTGEVEPIWLRQAELKSKGYPRLWKKFTNSFKESPKTPEKTASLLALICQEGFFLLFFLLSLLGFLLFLGNFSPAGFHQRPDLSPLVRFPGYFFKISSNRPRAPL